MAGKIAGRKYTNLGLVFACLSWITLPIVFGPVSVFLGVKGYMEGDTKRGIITSVLGVVFAFASTVIGAYFYMLQI